ncbi:MAG: sulfotransferase [Deltaproteobacteria bacterium]|nr:sulfotransferase [Deltaproteobacteria bacterium]
MRRLFSHLYAEPSMSRGRPRWGIKEIRPNAVEISRFLLELYPEARFVYLVRDPYDTLVSSLGMPFVQRMEKPEANVLKTWTDNTRSFLSPQEMEGIPCRLVKYEDLIKQTRSHHPLLEDLMEFLNLPVVEAMFGALSAKLTGSGPDKRNEQLTGKQCDLVTETTRSLREHLGYPDRSIVSPTGVSEERKRRVERRHSGVSLKKPLS